MEKPDRFQRIRDGMRKQSSKARIISEFRDAVHFVIEMEIISTANRFEIRGDETTDPSKMLIWANKKIENGG